jgi:hypothetical protein
MRIKFQKGMTPEDVTSVLLDYINENNLIVGSVNVFLQLFDEEGKAINDFKDPEMLVYSTSNTEKYADYVAKIRRRCIKAV